MSVALPPGPGLGGVAARGTGRALRSIERVPFPPSGAGRCAGAVSPRPCTLGRAARHSVCSQTRCKLRARVTLEICTLALGKCVFPYRNARVSVHITVPEWY